MSAYKNDLLFQWMKHLTDPAGENYNITRLKHILINIAAMKLLWQKSMLSFRCHFYNANLTGNLTLRAARLPGALLFITLVGTVKDFRILYLLWRFHMNITCTHLSPLTEEINCKWLVVSVVLSLVQSASHPSLSPQSCSQWRGRIYPTS